MIVKIMNKRNGLSIVASGEANGSLHTVLPRHIAVELGLTIEGEVTIESCCSLIKANYSHADLMIGDKSIHTLVLISDYVDEVIIGISDLKLLQ
ncbi:hypothetical protein [Caldivirga sp. UBA161]|uniref:hypothetical protein n=1 Tax=Caldivirga sp. UBA161 TaxID=1915569 RepID=UPI0025C3E65C|nr:hypothetical protein [Caldivirga sp. UBA161]